MSTRTVRRWRVGVAVPPQGKLARGLNVPGDWWLRDSDVQGVAVTASEKAAHLAAVSTTAARRSGVTSLVLDYRLAGAVIKTLLRERKLQAPALKPKI